MKVEKLIEVLSKLNPGTEFEVKGDILIGEIVEIVLQIDLEENTIEQSELDIIGSLLQLGTIRVKQKFVYCSINKLRK